LDPRVSRFLRLVDPRAYRRRKDYPLAAAEQSELLDAPDVVVESKSSGAPRQIQRRSDQNESGGDEALQGLRDQSGWRLSADDDSNPHLLRPVQNAWPGGGAAERVVPMGEGFVPA